MFTGVAAHTISQMPSLVTSGAGLMLATLAHAVGWPIPVGGSQAIPDALIADLRPTVANWSSARRSPRPPDGVVLYDTAPTALLRIYGEELPAAVREGAAPLPIRAGRRQGRLRTVRRDPLA